MVYKAETLLGGETKGLRAMRIWHIYRMVEEVVEKEERHLHPEHRLFLRSGS